MVPRVGVGVIVIKDKKILLGKRKNSHGDSTWCFPGGHLEFGETPQECAIRETREETGLEIKNLQTLTFTNDVFEKEKKHYITIFILSEYASGQLELKEPEKCSEWKWFAFGDFPKPLFLPTENLIKQIQNGSDENLTKKFLRF